MRYGVIYFQCLCYLALPLCVVSMHLTRCVLWHVVCIFFFCCFLISCFLKLQFVRKKDLYKMSTKFPATSHCRHQTCPHLVTSWLVSGQTGHYRVDEIPFSARRCPLPIDHWLSVSIFSLQRRVAVLYVDAACPALRTVQQCPSGNSLSARPAYHCHDN